MEKLFFSIITLISLTVARFDSEKIIFPLSEIVTKKIELGWEIEDILLNESKISIDNFVVLKKANQKALFLGDKLIMQGIIDEYSIIYTNDENEFCLKIKIKNKITIITRTENFENFERVTIVKSSDGFFPLLLMNKKDHYYVYDGKNKVGPIIAKESRILNTNGENYLINFNIYSQQINGTWHKRFQFIENGRLSPIYEKLIHWSISDNNYLILYQLSSGIVQFKNGYEISLPSSNSIRIKSNDKAIYILESKRGWEIFNRGLLYGPYEQKPLAVKEVNTKDVVYIAKQGENFNWFKDGVIISETEKFNFDSQAVQFVGDQFAILRKKDSKFEIYSNFKKIISFSTRPEISLKGDSILKFEGEKGESKFYGLYEIKYQTLIMKKEPINELIFKDDFFDFWLKEGENWLAYKEGKPLGSIKTEKKEELLVFIIKDRLFFPDWNYNDTKMVMLGNKKSYMGPFNSITPLEKPEQKKSSSRLYSSFTAQTDEGELAIYADAIIGPYKKVTPNRELNNPDKIVGLFIEFANLYYYFTKEDGMILQNQNKTVEINLIPDDSINKEQNNIENEISNLTKVIYCSKENSMRPWLAIETIIDEQQYYQIYYGKKAVFLTKSEQNSIIKVKEFPKQEVFMVEFGDDKKLFFEKGKINHELSITVRDQLISAKKDVIYLYYK